jgi:DNA repair exonuclease SbcCD ATPase subunit
MAWRLLALVLLVVACTSPRPPVRITTTPPDETERLVRLAETRAQAGEHAEAARLFEEVVRRPSPAVADRALAGLTRVLVHPEYAGRDYSQAFLVADRLVREYPDSQYTPEARAWRDVLGAYLALGQELEQRTRELDQRTQELDQRTQELDQRTLELERRTQQLERLKRLDVELARRTRELERRTQELERLKRLDLELERRTQELEQRTQELERLKRLDLELEQQRRKP